MDNLVVLVAEVAEILQVQDLGADMIMQADEFDGWQAPGFADDILTDEKLAVDVPAYAFSGRAVENALLNKITAKAKPAKKVEAEPEPMKEEPAPEEPEVKPGRTIAELMARLNLIKP